MLIRILGAQWFATAVFALVSFVLGVFVGRVLGPEKYGAYANAISLGSLLAILIDGGFGKILMREAVSITEELTSCGDNLHGAAYGHALLVIGSLCLIILVFNEPARQPILLATVGAFGMVTLGQFSLNIFRGQGRMVHDAGLVVANRLLTAAFVGMVLLLGAEDPWKILAAQGGGAAVFVAFVMYLHGVRPRFNLSVPLYRAMLPMIWLDLVTVVYFRSDNLLMLLLNIPKMDIGYYGIAFRLIETILLFCNPVGVLLFRSFRLHEKMYSLPLSILIRPLLIAGLLGIITVLFCYMFADVLIPVLFGTEFIPAASILKVLSLSMIFTLANAVLVQAALAWNMEKICMIAATVAAVTSVLANYLLLPVYGVVAAGWMALVTQIVLSLLLVSGLIRMSLTRGRKVIV